MQELEPDEIDDVLERNGMGILALFDGTYPYAVPISFGYNGEKPIFAMQLGVVDESKKQSCLAETHKACFTVVEALQSHAWRSVVVTGELHEVKDSEALPGFQALAANAEFAGDFRVWGAPLEEANLLMFEMKIDEISGRKFLMTNE